MAVSKNKDMSDIKAVAGVAGLPQAVHLWRKVFEIENHHFEDAPTEKQLSIATWEDCTDKRYDEEPDRYKRLNNLVMAEMHRQDNKCKIIRIGPLKTKAGIICVKICRSDRKHAIQRQKHICSIAAGCIASAVEMNERHKLHNSVGQMVITATQQKVQQIDCMTQTDKDAAAKELATQQLIEAGRALGRQDAVNQFLDVLNQRPALLAVEEKIQKKIKQAREEK